MNPVMTNLIATVMKFSSLIGYPVARQFVTQSRSFGCLLSWVKMRSINWSAPNIWVFIAQLVEHCSANAEAMNSDLVDALKVIFFGLK